MWAHEIQDLYKYRCRVQLQMDNFRSRKNCNVTVYKKKKKSDHPTRNPLLSTIGTSHISSKTNASLFGAPSPEKHLIGGHGPESQYKTNSFIRPSPFSHPACPSKKTHIHTRNNRLLGACVRRIKGKHIPKKNLLFYTVSFVSFCWRIMRVKMFMKLSRKARNSTSF